MEFVCHLLIKKKLKQKIIIDKKYIENNLGELAKDMDLSKFIL